MNKTLTLMRQKFQTSSGLTPQFKQFYQTFKKELTAELNTIGASNIQFNRGHFYASGFYTVGEQAYYFSISDVRFFPDEKLLYRTAKDYKDFTGGVNQYVRIEAGMALKMLPDAPKTGKKPSEAEEWLRNGITR